MDVKRLPTLMGAATLALASFGCRQDTTGPDIPSTDLPILFAQGRLYVSSDTGGSVVTLMDDADLSAMYAEWSPTGEHILMWARASDGPRDLYVLEADGSNRVQISDVPGDVSHFPAWSPDGERVAFSGSTSTLYVVDRDGTNQLELASGEHSGVNPDWAPDESWIAYGGYGPEGQGIYRVRPDGSDHEFLTSLGSWDDGLPRYSPDGDRIAFHNGQDIYLVDADGGSAEALTDTPSDGDWFPRWSPDGSRMAFHTDGGAFWAIGVMDVATGEMVETFGQHPNFDALYPSWAPDGQRIAFQVGGSVAVRALGTVPEWIGIGPGRYPSWHPGG